MYFSDKTTVTEAVKNNGAAAFDEDVQLQYNRDAEGNLLDEDGNIVDQSEGSGNEIEDQDALLEALLVDCISRLPEDARKAYLESEEFQGLYEAGVTKHRTLVRLSRADDLERRTHLAAVQMAREKGDADWEALRKNRVQERKLLNKIYAKYGLKVKQDAIKAQKRLISLTPNIFNTMRAIR